MPGVSPLMTAGSERSEELDAVSRAEMALVRLDLWQENNFLRICEQIEALSEEFVGTIPGAVEVREVDDAVVSTFRLLSQSCSCS